MPGGQVPGRTSYPRTSAMEDKFPQLFDSIKKGLALVLLVLVLLALVLLDILQFVVTFTVGHITVVCGYSWQKLQLSVVTVCRSYS